MTARQVDGLMVVVLVAATVCLLSFWSIRMAAHQDERTAHGDPRDGPIVVKLAAEDSELSGIYYLPETATVLTLLDAAGVRNRDRLDRPVLTRSLITGDSVMVDMHQRLTLHRMNATERIALGLAVDLNRATVDELLLIPGIGESTAVKIVRFREASGSFKNLSDLMQLPGIKEKRLKQWERYLYLPR
jgi:competence ComEA-like helix-hairpin-helix protein